MVLIAACEAAPSHTRAPKQQMPPITMAEVVAGRVGCFAIDAMPAAALRDIQASEPYAGKGIQRGQVYLRFSAVSPVTMVYYRTATKVPARFAGDLTELPLRCVEVHFLAEYGKREDAERRQRLAGLREQLQALGLVPTGVLGVYVDGNGKSGVLIATQRGEWGLLFDGRDMVAAVRAASGQPLAEQVRDLDGLRRFAKQTTPDVPQVLTLAAAVPDVPGADEWRREVEGLLASVGDRIWRKHEQQLTTIAQQFAALPVDAIAARIDLLAKARGQAGFFDDGRGGYLAPLRTWHAQHVQPWLQALRERLGGGMQRRRVRRIYDDVAGVHTLASWARRRKLPGGKFRQQAIDLLAFELKLAAIDDEEPFTRFARRLGFAREHLPVHGRDELTFATDLGEQLRAVAAAMPKGTFAAQAAEGIGLGMRTYREAWPRHIAALHMAAAIHAAVARDWLSLDAWFDQLAKVDLEPLRRHHIQTVQKLADAARVALRARIAAMPVPKAPADAAVLRGLGAALGRDEQASASLLAAKRLLAAARAFRLPADEEAACAAIAAFAARTSQYGPASRDVAAALAAPLARRIVERAEAHAADGHHGLAALAWLRAATLADATGLPPQRAAVVLLNSGAVTSADEQTARSPALMGARAQRAAWLAMAAIQPKVADDDPAFELADRYFRAQMGGASAASRWFGLRLDGCRDVGRRGAARLHLVETANGPGWAVPGQGEPVDLAGRQIDVAGWARLRKLRAEIRALDDELETMKQSEGMPREEIDRRQQQLVARIQGLQADIEAGRVMRAEGQRQLQELEAEAAPLRSTIQNWNRRAARYEELRRDRNKKVAPYNDLLSRLTAQLATAWRHLIAPATAAYLRAELAKSSWPVAEREARAWLLGLRATPPTTWSLPTEHPAALARLVQDVSDEGRGAAALVDAFERRCADRVRLSEATREQNAAALAPAFTAYVRRYGVDAAVRHLVGRGKPLHAWLAPLQGALTKEQQQALTKSMR